MKCTVPLSISTANHGRRFAHILLLTSERAWAHAMHMKSTRSTGTTTGTITGSARKHIISRLTKAYNTADGLFRALNDQSVNGGVNNDNILEARAYASSLDGARQFEKQNWKECLTSFSTARIIYTSFLSVDKKEVFKDILTSVVDPSLRYAAYRSQIPRSQPVPAIARRFFPQSDTDLVSLINEKDLDLLNDKPSRASSAEQENIPKTITWRTRTVEIEDATISLALASVNTASNKLSNLLNSDNGNLSANEKAAAYDEVLIASQDVVDATKHAIEELIGENVGQSDKRMQALQVTRTAVNYSLIGWRIGRNRILAGPQDGAVTESERIRKRPRKHGTDGGEVVERPEGTGRQLGRFRERVVLYDAILQACFFFPPALLFLFDSTTG